MVLAQLEAYMRHNFCGCRMPKAVQDVSCAEDEREGDLHQSTPTVLCCIATEHTKQRVSGHAQLTAQ